MPLLPVEQIEQLAPVFKGKIGNTVAGFLRKVLSIKTLSDIYDTIDEHQGADFAGAVFQKYNLIPAMNVFENIVLPAKLLERTVNEKEVFHLAKTLGIEEKLFQMPDELSGGQQQRAAIARAVYTHPTILLGDELTGNLDSRTSASVMELLKKISRQYQQTMLVVTHDEKIAAMADRIIRMKDGRVVEDERL